MVVPGVEKLEDIIVKLTLEWLVRLYSAGQVLQPSSCDILPLVRGLLDVLTSETIEEESREGLKTTSCRRGVIMNLPFLLDYIVESFEFNFGTEVFPFMEFVAGYVHPDTNSLEISHGQASEDIRITIRDVFLTHILLSPRLLDELDSDLKRVRLGLSYETTQGASSSNSLEILRKWTQLQCTASRRAHRYTAQKHFTRYLVRLELNKINRDDPEIIRVSLHLLSHKDVFRLPMLKRLLSIHLHSDSLPEQTKKAFIESFHVLHIKE